MRTISLTLLGVVVLVALGCRQENARFAASADQVDSKIAVISMTSDPSVDLQQTNMGLIFAGFCLDEGYDVNLFLNVKGVKLATTSFPEDTRFGSHAPLKEQLVDLQQRGAKIHVCPVCMDDLGIEAEQIIPAAFVTSKPKLFAKLGDDTMVFTY